MLSWLKKERLLESLQAFDQVPGSLFYLYPDMGWAKAIAKGEA